MSTAPCGCQITALDNSTNGPPPALTIRSAGGHTMAAWAGFESAYVLEGCGDLRQTNSWQAVAAPISFFGGWTTVPRSATNSTQFYQLRWDPSAVQF